MIRSYSKIAAIGSIVFGCGAFWRAILAIQHYRTSLAAIDDTSLRELAQASALLELGLSIILLGHAIVAAFFIRHPFRLNAHVIVAVAMLAGVIITGSLLRIPILSVSGLLPVLLIPGCSLGGFFSEAPWTSSYIGALVGGFLGFYFAAPTFEPFAMMAVMVPPVIFAMFGVSLGRLLRRFAPSPQVS